MCWNADVSIKTYIFALIVFFLGLRYQFNLPMLIFFLVFSQMQLVEYFLWTNLNNKKNNEFYSKVGLFNICIQPIAALLMIDNFKLKIYSILIYLLFLIYFFYNYYNTIDFHTKIGIKGSLHWVWLPTEYNMKTAQFSFAWFFFFLLGVFLSKDIILIIFVISTIIFSMYNSFLNYKFASYWCSISNLIWIYVLLYIVYQQYKKMY